jgi:hypothetical protein
MEIINPSPSIFVVISGDEPKTIGIGPIIISPPIWLFAGCCIMVRTVPSNNIIKPINMTVVPTLRKS